MSDSDSDYVVEEYIRPSKITAEIRNDEGEDLLGNFDDKKLKVLDKGSGSDGGGDSDDDEKVIYHKKIRINDYNSTDQDSSEEEEIGDDGAATTKQNGKLTKTTSTGITDEQLTKLLTGSKKTNRFVLYITNLSAETTKAALQDLFSQSGTIKSIRIPKKRSNSFAFVEMVDVGGLRNGLNLHNTLMDGKQIKVQISEGGKKKSANKKNIMKQKNRCLAEFRNETKSFLKSGKSFGATKTAKKRAWANAKEKKVKK